MSKSTDHITGIFVRIKRDDGFWNADLACMTDDELETFLRTKEPEWNLNCAKLLAGWIRDNVRVDESSS